jgi:hypothetical protein
MANRSIAQALFVEGRRLRESSPNDHAVAVSGAAVTHRTVDVESLLAADENLARDRHRKRCRKLVTDLSGKELFVIPQFTARNRVGRWHSRSTAVTKKVLLRQRL